MRSINSTLEHVIKELSNLKSKDDHHLLTNEYLFRIAKTLETDREAPKAAHMASVFGLVGSGYHN